MSVVSTERHEVKARLLLLRVMANAALAVGGCRSLNSATSAAETIWGTCYGLSAIGHLAHH